MNQRFLNMYTDYIFVEHPPAKADILFIPGSNAAALGERAAALWREGYAPVVIPSGKYSILTGRFGGALCHGGGVSDGRPCEKRCGAGGRLAGAGGYVYV